MKTYNQFTNEGIEDLLSPKSDDYIRKELSKYKPIIRMKKILTSNLPDKFKPSKEELIEDLGRLDTEDKVYIIIIFDLPFNLIPRDKDGFCHYESDVSFRYHKLKKLPDNFIINGDLNIQECELEKLPKGLKVNGNLNCSDNNLTELPDDLSFKWSLNCSKNKITKLPYNFDNIIIDGGLNCSRNKLTELPKLAEIKGNLNCSNNKITSLPEGLKIHNCLYCSYNELTELPKGLAVKNDVFCSNNPKELHLPPYGMVLGRIFNY